MENIKNLIRMASKIQQALSESRNKQWLEFLSCLSNFAGKLKEISLDSRKIGISLSRNWFAAARRCSSRINRALDEITYSTQRAKQLTQKPEKNIPELRFLVDELNQLQQEFSNVEFESSEEAISVVTEPVNLEGIYLGPFKIQLQLDMLSDFHKDSPYCCIALDPYPAATSEDVTHPHVNNHKLCEGEGSAAIRAALEQGRLCDFFTMVKNILNTYSPDSPYISLADWTGTPCYDCGYVMDGEDTYYCGFCDHDYCSDCSSYCQICDETLCLGCGGQCPQCEEIVCSNCIGRCSECDELCCRACLEDNLCPNCKKEMENENEEQEDQITTASQSKPESTDQEVKLAG